MFRVIPRSHLIIVFKELGGLRGAGGHLHKDFKISVRSRRAGDRKIPPGEPPSFPAHQIVWSQRRSPGSVFSASLTAESSVAESGSASGGLAYPKQRRSTPRICTSESK